MGTALVVCLVGFKSEMGHNGLKQDEYDEKAPQASKGKAAV
jgi:hypothetical protein